MDYFLEEKAPTFLILSEDNKTQPTTDTVSLLDTKPGKEVVKPQNT